MKRVHAEDKNGDIPCSKLRKGGKPRWSTWIQASVDCKPCRRWLKKLWKKRGYK